MVFVKKLARLGLRSARDKPADSDAAALNAATNAVREQAQVVANAKERLDGLRERVSATERLVWPTSADGDLPGNATSPGNSAQTKVPLGDLGCAKLAGLFVSGVAPGIINQFLDDKTALQLLLEPVAPLPAQTTCDSGQGAPCTVRKLEGDAAEGLIYRSPVPANLLACHVEDPKKTCTAGDVTALVVKANILTPQLGPRRLLPMTNGAFQNNTIQVTFREAL